MLLKKNNIKNELVYNLTSYSRYYCRLYFQCEDMYEERKGHFALFNLFALLENITKTVLNDFEEIKNNISCRIRTCAGRPHLISSQTP